jgi:hypothetical protein
MLSSQFSAKNLAFLSKANVMIKFLQKLAVVGAWVARFFLGQHTKTSKDVPKRGKIYQMGHKHVKGSEN